MIKAAAALVLALFVSGCDAQGPYNPRSPVGVAYGLYTGCLSAQHTVGVTVEPRTFARLQEVVGELDEYCLTWTLVWLPAMTGVPLQDIPRSHVDRFSTLRLQPLERFGQELAVFYKIRLSP